MLRRAIDRTGRPIVLSLSYGPMPLEQADALVENANAWRLLGDLWDYWDQVLPAFRRLHEWTPFAGPGPLARPGHAAARPSALPSRGLVQERDHESGLFRHGLARRPGGRAQLPEPRRAEDDHDALGDRPLPVDVRRPPPGERRLDALAHHQSPRSWPSTREAATTASSSTPTGSRPGPQRTRRAGPRIVAVFNTCDREEKGPEPGIAVPVRLADLGLAGPVAVTDVWTGEAGRRSSTASSPLSCRFTAPGSTG